MFNDLTKFVFFTGKGGVEIQLVQPLDTQFCQTAAARLAAHQTKGRCVGGKVLARMRGKRHNAQWGIRCGAAGQIYDGLMTQMHAIKIANRGAGTAINWLDKLVISDDPHGVCVAMMCGGIKRCLTDLTIGCDAWVSPTLGV